MIKRPLMQKEIEALKAAGNTCDNWNNIRVAQNFTAKNIVNSKFTGKIKLHGFSGKTLVRKGTEFQTGIFNSWINESVVEDACIYDVKLFSNSVACEDALIFDVGSITCDKEMDQIKVGTEMGYRVLKRQFSENERTVIGRGARVCNVSSLENSHLGDYACIENGALVRDSLLENNCVVTDNAIVKSSFIGSFSHIGEAEVTSSLVGPLVQMHHHSLLISALWPEGRGNVGYGANVGSNHTGRMPDQEIMPGLGMFFGLGCCIKFPANFSDAPFTMIATGVVCEPMRLRFPFTLIKKDEIIPGWVYVKNIYGVLRSIYKWDKRSGTDDNIELLYSKQVLNCVKLACNILKDTDFLEISAEAYELYVEDYSFYIQNKKLNPSIIPRIEKNWERDCKRGQEIFDNYMDFHPKDKEFLDYLHDHSA